MFDVTKARITTGSGLRDKKGYVKGSDGRRSAGRNFRLVGYQPFDHANCTCTISRVPHRKKGEILPHRSLRQSRDPSTCLDPQLVPPLVFPRHRTQKNPHSSPRAGRGGSCCSRRFQQKNAARRRRRR